MITNYGKKYVYKNTKGKRGGKMAVVLTDAHLVKTRKNHICQGCGKTMPKGSKCYVTTYADGGKAYTIRECEECRDYFVENCRDCDNYDFCLGENYQIGAIQRCRQAALGGGIRES